MKHEGKEMVTGALGTVSKGRGLDELEIRGQIETIQTTALLRSARILWRVLETYLDFIEMPPADAGVKNSQGVKDIIED